MLKSTIRAEIKTLRENLSETDCAKKSRNIFNQLISMREFVEAKVIYIYVNINNEVSTREIIEYSLKAGKEVAIPKIEEHVMSFYKIQSVEELQTGYFNIPEPVNKIKPSTPDIVLVPGVAFSYGLERLGYGGGYYDRFLTEDVLKIGLAFDFQLYEELPVESHDIPMDIIITDKEIIR